MMPQAEVMRTNVKQSVTAENTTKRNSQSFHEEGLGTHEKAMYDVLETCNDAAIRSDNTWQGGWYTDGKTDEPWVFPALEKDQE